MRLSSFELFHCFVVICYWFYFILRMVWIERRVSMKMNHNLFVFKCNINFVVYTVISRGVMWDIGECFIQFQIQLWWSTSTQLTWTKIQIKIKVGYFDHNNVDTHLVVILLYWKVDFGGQISPKVEEGRAKILLWPK